MNASDQAHGSIPGKLPAVVVSYNQDSRECRVHIPGLTDGAEMGLLAQIEYPIGDKSRESAYSTDIAIFEGDPVWIEFECGDPRYPIITGYRNPNFGNGTEWRRFHQKNIELIGDELIRFRVGRTVLDLSDSGFKLVTPAVDIEKAG